MSDSTHNLDQVSQSVTQRETQINALFDAGSPSTIFGRRSSTCAGLVFGYYGGEFASANVANGTVTATASNSNYVVVHRSTLVVSISTSNTNWNDTATYGRMYLLTAGASSITSYVDHRMRDSGILLTTGGAGSVTSVDITAPAAGITAAGGPITSSGAITLALANDLAALEGLGDGYPKRTGTDTWTNKTATQVTADLDAMVGDSGSGGTKGLVPAPASGDAAAVKFLKANGTWAAVTAAAAGSTTQIQYNSSGSLAGSANLAWDNSLQQLNLFGASNALNADIFGAKTVSGEVFSMIQNQSSNAAAFCSARVANNSQFVRLSKYGASYTTSGLLVADMGVLWNSNGKLLVTNADTSDMIFAINGTGTTNEVLRLATATVTMGTAGSTKFTFDSTNVRLGVGVTPSKALHVSGGTNGEVAQLIVNTTSGSAAYSALFIANNTASFTDYFGLFKTSTGYTPAGLLTAGVNYLTGSTGNILIQSGASLDVIVAAGGTATGNEGFRVDSNLNVSVGNAAIATNAANGFLYVTACAGPPTGTPTSKSGRVPIVVDSTNGKAYIYVNSAWAALN